MTEKQIVEAIKSQYGEKLKEFGLDYYVDDETIQVEIGGDLEDFKDIEKFLWETFDGLDMPSIGVRSTVHGFLPVLQFFHNVGN